MYTIPFLISSFFIAARARVLHKYDLTQIDPRAVCNDGSPVILYTDALPPGNNTDYFVLYLEDGGHCYDSESCEERFNANPDFVSSKGRPRQIEVFGFLNQIDTLVHTNAFVAFLSYCTSDSYLGDFNFTTNNGLQLQFRGNVATRAAVQFLKNINLGGGVKQTLLLSGCSAGARGASYHLEQVRGMFNDNLDVLGVFDSALWIDVDTYDDVHIPFREELRRFSRISNWVEIEKDILSQECVNRYRNESWKCILGEYQMPFVKPPYFLSSSQWDQFQLNHNLGYHIQFFLQKSVWNYIEDFGLRSLEAIWNVSGSARSSGCYKHCVSTTDADFTLKNSKIFPSFKEAVQEFLTDPNTRKFYRPLCEQFDCDCCDTNEFCTWVKVQGEYVCTWIWEGLVKMKNMIGGVIQHEL